MAARVIDISAKKLEPEKNPAAVALGRLGGLKGGKARAEKLTPMERTEIAQRAAKQRWANRKSMGVEATVDQTVTPKKALKLP